MITDSRGHDAGSRPGFLFADDQVDEAVRETVYRKYADAVIRKVEERALANPNEACAVRTADVHGGDAVAASYAQYNRDIQERWRR